jgi:two-component system cell cycle sensor histidine kinase/response regulator CckA
MTEALHQGEARRSIIVRRARLAPATRPERTVVERRAPTLTSSNAMYRALKRTLFASIDGVGDASDRQARTLKLMLGSVELVIVLSLFGVAFVFVKKAALLVFFAALSLLAGSIHVMIARNRVRAASLTFVVGLGVAFTIAMALSRGVASPLTAMFVTLTGLAGMLFGPRGATATGLASGLAVITLYLLERAGLLPPPYFPMPAASATAVLMLGLVLIVFPLTHALSVYAEVLAERNRALATAQSSEEKLRFLIDNIHDVIWTLDVETLRFTYVSPSVERLRGFTASEVLDQTLAEALTPESAAHVAALTPGRIAHFLETGSNETFVDQVEQPRRDGTTVWIETITYFRRNPESGHVEVIGTSRNIDARRRAEEALRKREADLAKSQAFAHLGSYSWDLRTGAGEWSDELRAIWGFDASDAPSVERLIERIHPEDRPRVVEAGRRMQDQQTMQLQEEYRIVRPDGRTRHLRDHAEFELGPGGQPVSVFGTVLDITAQKQLEAQLRAAQKMEAIGQLAGGIAHDFNNILATMVLNLDLLRGAEGLAPEDRSAVEELKSATSRATGLTRQLLMFGRRSVMENKPLELGELLEHMRRFLDRLISERVHLSVSGAPKPIWIEADAGMLEQIVMNLVVNARDAMPSGGHIGLSAAEVDIDGAHVERSPSARVGRYACLTVVDDGAGIEPWMLEHIFEPFFTTKEVGKGTGLGLATVHGIVMQHRGWIEVDSAVGRGTTFRVFFPVAERARAEAPATKALDVPVGHETILLVEDEPAVRRTVARYLQRCGYVIVEAKSGAEALEQWAKNRGRIDLLFTDMVMPGLSGRELAKQLRGERPELPVILSSGYSAELLEGPEAEVSLTYLPKPCDPTLMARTVRSTLDGARR